MRTGRLLLVTLVILGAVCGGSAWLGHLERAPGGQERITSDFNHATPWAAGSLLTAGVIAVVMTFMSVRSDIKKSRREHAQALDAWLEYETTHRTEKIDVSGMTLASVFTEAVSRGMDPVTASFSDGGTLTQVWEITE